MSVFQKGEVVRSNVDAQGLTKGKDYTVSFIKEIPTPFGTFTTYYVKDEGGKEFAVTNGHMVLTRERSQ